MKIDRTKFTAQYENGAIKSMWVSVEIAMDSGMGEDPKAALDLSKKTSDEWYEQQGGWLYRPSYGDAAPVKSQEKTITDWAERVGELDKEYEAAKAAVSAIEYREDAILWMNNNGWTFNMELKNIANSKPSKPQ